jgi:glutamyl-tRNA reductase
LIYLFLLIINFIHDALNQACHSFQDWFESHLQREEVKQYRALMEQEQKQLELKALKQLEQGEDPTLVLQEFSYKLTQKLLHKPSMDIKEFMVKSPIIIHEKSQSNHAISYTASENS